MGLSYQPGVREFLATLAPKPKKRLKKTLQALERDPRGTRLDLRRLRTKDRQIYYRCRVGDYRIVYTPVPGGAVVWRIFHRADGYEWLEELFP